MTGAEAVLRRWRPAGRALPVPIIGRIYDGRLWLDIRCLEDETRFMEDDVEMIIATAGHVDHGKNNAITGDYRRECRSSAGKKKNAV
ncbi:selenocysteine synthase [Citrobacter koseri]|uniref:Selenocysteine synthase n=1 Tax=Citrobacter koseri TaxID=545 RepID=A0A2X2WI52_CITKO|nr:selenocysteine synthase [Citrobacter koseri]